jgi:hypothetical protein
MNIGEILIWEATNILLLIPVVIALVILTRWIRRLPLFTDRDWLFLLGRPREKVLSLHLWLDSQRSGSLWCSLALLRVTFSCRLVSHPSSARCFSLLL